jgi:hypothetical protein
MRKYLWGFILFLLLTGTANLILRSAKDKILATKFLFSYQKVISKSIHPKLFLKRLKIDFPKKFRKA